MLKAVPVREYSREFAAQCNATGLKAITLARLRHSNISRMRVAGIAADVVAAWHSHTECMTLECGDIGCRQELKAGTHQCPQR